MTDQRWTPATKEQTRQVTMVQTSILNEINLMAREGIEPKVLIAGLGAAAADAVTAIYGNKAVPLWFADQAKATYDLVHGTKS